jgi:AcrR family transcriptional regulator
VRLIEAAVEIINQEGYGAVSARALAERVGLKRQIVHYYFGTIDELLLAVVRHYGELGLARLSEAFVGGDPLRVIWEVETDASATAFAFMAMARHRPVIRNELRRYLNAFRDMQIEAIVQYAERRGMKLTMPAAAASIIVQSVASTLIAEEKLGATVGHVEARAAIEALMATLMQAD